MYRIRRRVRVLLAVTCSLLLPLSVQGASALAPGDGRAAPPLSLQDTEGRRHTLAGYRGNVVLINFWATWCEPCRREMPSIQRLKEKLSDKPFVVLAVNVDEPEARVRQ